MSEEKLTYKQIRSARVQAHEHYLEAKKVIESVFDKQLEAIQNKCPHEHLNSWDKTCYDCRAVLE